MFFDNVDVASVLDDEVLSNEMCREAKAGASTGGRRRLGSMWMRFGGWTCDPEATWGYMVK